MSSALSALKMIESLLFTSSGSASNLFWQDFKQWASWRTFKYY